MRQGSNTGRRPRGRTNRKQHGSGGGGGGGGQSRTHTFDSNGPDGRVRGNARQVYEKYLSLARDAYSAGDRIAAEAYFQHAEHYFRILSDTTDPTPRRPQEERQPQAYSHDDGDYGDDDDQPVNGHGGGDRQHEARNNGNSVPQAPRDHGPRENGPREHGNREQGARHPRDNRPRDGQPRDDQSRDSQPRDSQPRASQPRDNQSAAVEPVGEATPQGGQDAKGGDGDGQQQRPRRGRPRKPRSDDEATAAQPDTTPETESGPAAS
jgi:hypothetical protein